jgi:hypothetical protein
VCAASSTRINKLLADCGQGNEEARVSTEATAVVRGVSPATVKREWVTASAWLRHELKKGAGK